MKVWLAGLVVIAGCLAGLTGRADGAVGSLSGGILTVSDTVGERNELSVEPLAFSGIEVYDAAAPVSVGSRCAARSAHDLVCMGFTLRVVVNAGAGDDLVDLRDVAVPTTVDGGPGADGIAGGGAPDDLRGGAGPDSLAGGGSVDRLAGEDGNDLLVGGDGSDTLLGGAGDDILQGDDGSGDVLIGGAGADLIRGGAGNDVLEGGAGDDVLIGNTGDDTVSTGTGSDTVLGANHGRDRIDCRPGDGVQGEQADRPAQCGAIPETQSAPDEWPPTSDVSARAATTFNAGIRVVKRHAPRKYWVTIEQPTFIQQSILFDVRVTAYRHGHRLYRRCFSRVWSKKPHLHRLTRRAYRATAVHGEVLRGTHC